MGELREMGPAERYRAELGRPGFVHDPAQERAVGELQRVYEELTGRPARGRMRRLVSRVAGDSREPVMGLYLWGVKQGDPPVTERPRGWPAEVRGAVVAGKRSNVRGAKGARKVEARWTDEAK